MRLTNWERIALGGWVTVFIGLLWLVIVLAASLFTAGGDDPAALVRQCTAGIIAVIAGFAAVGLAKWSDR